MTKYRNALPQLSGGIFLNDAGLETDIIFNKGVEIREFAAHTLLPDPAGREVLTTYFREMLSLAQSKGAGFVLDCPTWKAHMHWAGDLKASEEEIKQANLDAVAFAAGLREEFSSNEQPIVINALIGPRGDANIATSRPISPPSCPSSTTRPFTSPTPVTPPGPVPRRTRPPSVSRSSSSTRGCPSSSCSGTGSSC